MEQNNFFEMWELYTNNEKELFQKSCRKLLKHTFIVKENPLYKKYYQFISNINNFAMLEEYFSFIGFDVVIDRANGVVMLKSSNSSENKFQLSIRQSIILVVLWMLYSDKLNQITLTKTINISLEDLRHKLTEFELRDEYKKTELSSILSMFSKFNLISTHGDIGQEDFTIRLYPSLLFCLDFNSFEQLISAEREKLHLSSSVSTITSELEDNIEDDSEQLEDYYQYIEYEVDGELDE